VPDVDRSKLQRDILELVQQHGARVAATRPPPHDATPPLPPAAIAAVEGAPCDAAWLRVHPHAIQCHTHRLP
jgi:hypothetical protein